VPKQLRPDIRSQYSWQVSQSNWPPARNPTGQRTPINPRRDHQGLAERRLGVVNERRCCLIRGHCVTRNPSRSVSRALANGFTFLTATDWSHGGCARPDHRRGATRGGSPSFSPIEVRVSPRRTPSRSTGRTSTHCVDRSWARRRRRVARPNHPLCIGNSLSRSVSMCRASVTGDRRTHRTPRRNA